MTNNHHMTTPKERMSDERLTDVRAMYGDFHAIEECLAEIDALRAELAKAERERDSAREEARKADAALSPLDAVVHHLGIEDSFTEPVEAIKQIERERDEAERNWAEQEERGTIAQTDLNIALNKLATAERERDEARAALAKAREDDLTGLELKFAERAEGQRQWISENAPYISHDQKHLDADTVERAYWYYGYCIALGDVVGQIKTTLAALTPTQESETP